MKVDLVFCPQDHVSYKDETILRHFNVKSPSLWKGLILNLSRLGDDEMVNFEIIFSKFEYTKLLFIT